MRFWRSSTTESEFPPKPSRTCSNVFSALMTRARESRVARGSGLQLSSPSALPMGRKWTLRVSRATVAAFGFVSRWRAEFSCHVTRPIRSAAAVHCRLSPNSHHAARHRRSTPDAGGHFPGDGYPGGQRCVDLRGHERTGYPESDSDAPSAPDGVHGG